MRKQSRVTIILALKCKDSIVVASDSRTTYERIHRDDTRKVQPVTFADELGILLATAGSDDTGAIITNQLQRLAIGEKLTGDEKPERVFQQSVLEYRKRLVEAEYGSMEGLQKARLSDDRLDCDLLIAYYFNERQRLYSVNVGFGLVTPRAQNYLPLGIGSEVASYLMQDLGDVSGMSTNEAIFTSIFVVDEVKKSVNGCGGNTQIGVIGPTNKPEILTHETISEMEKETEYLREKQRRALSEASSNIAQAALQYQSLQPHSSDWHLQPED